MQGMTFTQSGRPDLNPGPPAPKAWSREAHLRRKSVSMRGFYGSVKLLIPLIWTKSASELTQLLTHLAANPRLQ